MDWLYKSFQEYSVAWLLISGILGGAISFILKFFFDEIIGHYLKKKREVKKVVKHYTAPLIRTGSSLERRVNNIIRNIDKGWLKSSEYYELSTLFIFGEFFAWVYILEQRVNYLQFSSSRKTKIFENRLNGIFRAMTSLSSYFRQLPDTEEKLKSNVPRLVFRAIGEKMTKKEDGQLYPISYSEFTESFKKEPDKYSSIVELKKFLHEVDPKQDTIKWDRLIILGANLRKLLYFLKKKRRKVPYDHFVNIELIKNKEIKAEFLNEK
jgi:phosphate/sulfate permease